MSDSEVASTTSSSRGPREGEVPRGRRKKDPSPGERMYGISLPTMRKFAYASGAKIFTDEAADKIRECAFKYFEDLMAEVVAHMKKDGRTTIHESDVLATIHGE